MSRRHTTAGVEIPHPKSAGMNLVTSRSVLTCDRAEEVFRSGENGPVWRLVRGWVRVDQEVGPRRLLVQLAQPGDLLGTEVLCGAASYRFSATAFTDCVLERVRPQSAEQQQALLQQAVLQQLQLSARMAALRTGPVPQRLGHLLDVMGYVWRRSEQADAIRKALPPLREIADVVDAKTETVCRAMAQLMPSRGRSSQVSLETVAPRPAVEVWGTDPAPADWQPMAA